MYQKTRMNGAFGTSMPGETPAGASEVTKVAAVAGRPGHAGAWAHGVPAVLAVVPGGSPVIGWRGRARLG
jgi:hypothetical protein